MSERAPTIYERLGGMVSIDVVVEHFYDRVIGDPELAAFFDDVDVQRLRRHQKAFLAMTLGGPDVVESTDLEAAHRDLSIDDRHMDLIVEHLAGALAGLGVLPALIDEAVATVDTVRDDVLGRR
jgi:hemoglobin